LSFLDIRYIFELYEEIISDVSQESCPITSEFLKFQLVENNTIFHFFVTNAILSANGVASIKISSFNSL
jgi:hypothetical protein